MAPVHAIHPELRAILAQIKSDGAKLAAAVQRVGGALEINANVMGDVRDALIRNTHAVESLLEFLRAK